MTQHIPVQEVQAAGGLEKWARKIAQAPAPTVAKNATVHKESLSVPQAKGRLPSDLLLGYDAERMNGLEARYAGNLEAQRKTGRIIFWRFESVKFRLADRTWYSPDFYLMRPDGSIEIHETKGWMEDDANVKIKTVAELFPEFLFVLVKWRNGTWEYKKYRWKG